MTPSKTPKSPLPAIFLVQIQDDPSPSGDRDNGDQIDDNDDEENGGNLIAVKETNVEMVMVEMAILWHGRHSQGALSATPTSSARCAVGH